MIELYVEYENIKNRLNKDDYNLYQYIKDHTVEK